jgi:hypothetical protein
MTAIDLNEYRQLKNTASELEKLVTASPHGVNPMLKTALANILARIEVLEIGLKEEQIRIEQSAAAQAAEQEAALSQSEKKTFAGFLKKDFFTQSDFRPLEDFYKNSWDKLSEAGKDEMTKRIQEGVNRSEYSFSELPAIVQEKELSREKALAAKDAQKPIPQEAAPSQSMANLDLSTIDLSGMAMADGTTTPVAVAQNLQTAGKQNSR